MLVVPVAEKFSWKNPPYVTLVLILMNIIVFTVFQGRDGEVFQRAIEYYFKSGLYTIEYPHYKDYRKEKEDPLKIPQHYLRSKQTRETYTFWEMENDEGFQVMLEQERVITPDSSEYPGWKEKRIEFICLKDAVFTNKYMFFPFSHKPVTFITHMFMHGGFGHLLGNMIFFWLFGCILEIGCGRGRFLAMYILSGFGALAFYWASHTGSHTGVLGASGAISGLMGAYTVLFGKSRIKLFLYLGFYFNYVRIPAIVLLPFWLGKELYSLFLGPETNVAYTAHIGGILSGVVAGLLILKYSDFKKHEVLKEEEVPDKTIPMMEKALEHLGKLEFDKAKALLKDVICENNRHYTAYEHLYTLEKQNPESQSYHDITRQYLTALCCNPAIQGRVFAVYNEYRRLTRPKLTPELYISLGIVFANQDHLDDAEQMIGLILSKKPDLPKIPAALLKLSEAFKRKSQDGKSCHYFNVLCKRYPDSQEAGLALRILKSQVKIN